MPPKKKAKTIPEIVDDIKKEVFTWGGDVETVTTMETGGRLKEIKMVIVFKLH